jgi:Bacterial capsule synthesis protein PGA_cap
VAGAVAALTAPAAASAQTPLPTPPPPLELHGPRVVATGTGFVVRGGNAAPGEVVRIEIRVRSRWARLARARADRSGRFDRRVRPHRLRRRYVLRAHAGSGAVSPRLSVRSRDVTLAAVGDINLGGGPGALISVFGPRYPWTGVAGALRRRDIAFGNLECAVSTRGSPVPKEFNFRGSPAALRPVARFAGFDVLNLANNHTGDYGTTALLDTVRNVRSLGMRAVGAGGSLASAAEPRVVERLGLRVAFVGFSNILPASFFAGPNHAGTQPATIPLIESGVRRARRRADVVIATFHWGVERAPVENERQRAFAAAALRAGATAVIGAHPHVLQPIGRQGRRLVAYSLGNFVFGAGSPGTTRTGILALKLSRRGVEASRLIPAHISAARPQLASG